MGKNNRSSMEQWAEGEGFSIKYLAKGFVHKFKTDLDFQMSTLFVLMYAIFAFVIFGPFNDKAFDLVVPEGKLYTYLLHAGVFIGTLLMAFVFSVLTVVAIVLMVRGAGWLVKATKALVGTVKFLLKDINTTGALESYKTLHLLSKPDDERKD